MQAQIRLLLMEQSDQGLHYLPVHLHLLDTLLQITAVSNQTVLFLGYLRQLFQVSQFLEFSPYLISEVAAAGNALPARTKLLACLASQFGGEFKECE